MLDFWKRLELIKEASADLDFGQADKEEINRRIGGLSESLMDMMGLIEEIDFLTPARRAEIEEEIEDLSLRIHRLGEKLTGGKNHARNH